MKRGERGKQVICEQIKRKIAIFAVAKKNDVGNEQAFFYLL